MLPRQICQCTHSSQHACVRANISVVNICCIRCFQNTALHIAAMKGKPAAVSLLLTMDAKLTTNNEDMTFFDYVIANRYKEVATSIVTHDR